MKIQRLLAFHKQSVNRLPSRVAPSLSTTNGTWRCFSVDVSSPQSPLNLETSHPALDGGGWTSVRELFDARAHLGHRVGSLDPRMAPYVWGSRLGHLVLDLDQTLGCLRRALDFTREISAREGLVLLVSSSPAVSIQVENAARAVGEYAHTRPWRLGTFTNSLMIFGAVTRLPDLVISIGSHQVLSEAAKMCIPTVAVLDTNCDPSLVTYPVPGNDDTPTAIQLYLRLFTKAIALGKGIPPPEL